MPEQGHGTPRFPEPAAGNEEGSRHFASGLRDNGRPNWTPRKEREMPRRPQGIREDREKEKWRRRVPLSAVHRRGLPVPQALGWRSCRCCGSDAHTSIDLSRYHSGCLPIYHSTILSIYSFVCLSIYLSIRLSVCLSTCLFIIVSMYLSACPSICIEKKINR